MTVITGVPNFPQGQIFAGYRNQLWQSEMMEGIRVIRVWTFVAANEGVRRRIVDYLSFMVSAICAALFVRRISVVVGTSPQFFTALAAAVVARLKGQPWVFELRDIWPESIKVVGAISNARVLSILERLEVALYRDADLIVAVTHGFKQILERRGINGAKVQIITNGVALEDFSPRRKDQQLERDLGLEGCFVAGYVGTHGMAHGLDTLLQSAQILRDTLGASAIRLLMIGDGAEKQRLRERSNELGLSNIIFLDSVPKSEIARYWSLLDVSIIHLKKTDLFRSVIPSKLFESMGMGIPVLLGAEGESADIVKQATIGETFEPENASELAQKLIAMSSNPEHRSLYAAQGPVAAQRYSRTKLARVMLRQLEDVASR